MKRFVLSALALAFVFAGASSAVSHAADAESIALSPTSKHYTFDPGTAKSDSVSVTNDGNQTYNFTVYARPYSVRSSNYEPDFGRLTTNADAYNWIQFEKTTYKLKPGQTAKIPYTITAPKNADGGGHYGVIFAQTVPTKKDKGYVVRQKRVGAIVYAKVKGDNRSQGELVSTSASFLQTNAPLSAMSIVKNTGNVDFVDKTSFTVKDVFGNKKYQNSRQLPVLPSTSRNINYTWQKGSSFGLYNVSITHDFLGKKTSASLYVLLLPTWLIVVVIVLILAAILYAIRRKTTKPVAKKRATKKAKK